MSKQPALKIEHGVPIPPVASRQGNNVKLLQQMKPGDSVFFDAPVANKAVRFYRVAKKLGVTICVRKENGGVRMWMVNNDALQDRPKAAPRAGQGAKAAKPAVARRSARSEPAAMPVKHGRRTSSHARNLRV